MDMGAIFRGAVLLSNESEGHAEIAAFAPRAMFIVAMDHGERFIDYSEVAIGKFREGRGVGSQQLTLPPHAFLTLLFHGAKPVLPEDRTDKSRRCTAEGIARKESEDCRVVFEEKFLSPWNDWVLLP